MSYKTLPNTHTDTLYPQNKSLCYKTAEIRFRDIDKPWPRKAIKPNIIIEKSPWISLEREELEKVVERLSDKPEDLYESIKAQKQGRKKFRLLLKDTDKQNNDRLLQLLQSKKKRYEQQFRALLRQPKSNVLTLIFPKLEGLKYLYGDKHHKIEGTMSPF